MDSLVPWIAKQCNEHLLAEKWLIAESLHIAQQWKDRINLSGQSTVNLHCQTLENIAVSLTSQQRMERHLNFANGATIRIIVQSLIGRLWDAGELEYFNVAKSGDGLSDVLSKSIRDLRLANVDIASMQESAFESSKKARDVCRIYGAYCECLRQQSFVDYADCLKLAVEGLVNKTIALPADVTILPEQPMCSTSERRLVAELSSHSILFHNESIDPYIAAVEQLPDRIKSRADTFAYFSGQGETNEVRGVFQRILTARSNEAICFDDVEIVHTDERYPPRIFEQLVGWLAETADHPSAN